MYAIFDILLSLLTWALQSTLFSNPLILFSISSSFFVTLTIWTLAGGLLFAESSARAMPLMPRGTVSGRAVLGMDDLDEFLVGM